ncbi:hypothetical protein QFC24_000685 [Naganishia onofrii]|uniref:Uncharacterized protein n=1 Tax=Naganishia onofrii TaxID=1851511 RepID=A0ACC2XWN6_9TREE|nr:hypothetical protein QFC24_000685 [Naganishia onofrii]
MAEFQQREREEGSSSPPRRGQGFITPSLHGRAASVPDDDVFYWRQGVPGHHTVGDPPLTNVEGGGAGDERKETAGQQVDRQLEEEEMQVTMMDAERASDVGTVIYPADSASEVLAVSAASPVAVNTAGTAIHSDLPIMGASERVGLGATAGRSKERDVSPLRNVRNVVAAWRGKLAAPGTPRVYDTPALRIDSAGGITGGGGGGGAGEGTRGDRARAEGKDRNVFEEAFFTIRRMSTRRRTGKSRATSAGGLPGVVPAEGRGEGESVVAGALVGREKPLPALRLSAFAAEPGEGVGRAVRGKLVSQVSEITSEVSS